jgi:hypothetical protein
MSEAGAQESFVYQISGWIWEIAIGGQGEDKWETKRRDLFITFSRFTLFTAVSFEPVHDKIHVTLHSVTTKCHAHHRIFINAVDAFLQRFHPPKKKKKKKKKSTLR